jgi:hypothetical protein
VAPLPLICGWVAMLAATGCFSNVIPVASKGCPADLLACGVICNNYCKMAAYAMASFSQSANTRHKNVFVF